MRLGRAALALLLVGAGTAGAGLAGVGTAGPAVAQGRPCDPGRVAYIDTPPRAFSLLGVDGTDGAWSLSRGEGTVVAVVDSGVNTANAHLGDGVLPGANLVDGGAPATADAVGHGTAVASQIAARPVDGSGLLGVAPAATVLPVRVYYDTDDGEVLTPERLAAGIRWSAENGADIINVSASTTVDLPALSEAVASARANGALVVASAGNRGTTEVQTAVPRYPAAYPGVLGVSAVDDLGSWDPSASFAGEHVDVVAPGLNVLAAFHAAGDCIVPGDNRPSSSYATAYVSGVAALVHSRHPEESPDQLAHRLMVTASRSVPGERTDETGWGVVQPYEALAFVDDGSAPGPDSPVHERPPAAPAEVADLDLSEAGDPLARGRQLVTWWLLGGLAFGCLVLLVARMGTSAPRRP